MARGRVELGTAAVEQPIETIWALLKMNVSKREEHGRTGNPCLTGSLSKRASTKRIIAVLVASIFTPSIDPWSTRRSRLRPS